MGSCVSHDDINASSKKIIRAIDIPDSGKQSKGMVLLYDVESNEATNFIIKLFPFKNLDSASQISIENCLYLLGEQGPNVKNGSLFIKIDLTAKMNQISILINSTHEHYKPSLAIFKKDYIVAIGGKDSKKCEIYHRNSNKWRTLPDLPEERFGCNLVSDDKFDLMYLFGGMDSKTKTYYGTVLKLNLKTSNNWESIPTKNSSNFERAFFSLIRVSKDTILIFGGSNSSSDYSNDVIEFDFAHKSSIIHNYKLLNSAKFDTYSYADYSSILFIVDDDNIIHKIIKRDNKCDLIQNFKEIESIKENVNQLQ